jgi:alpha-L-fucosidase
MQTDWLITGAFTCRGKTLYFHCNRWPGEELAIGGLRNKVVEARLYGGPAVKFTQVRDRLVLRGLPKQAPDPLATVIELTIAGGKPVLKRGAGCVLLK